MAKYLLEIQGRTNQFQQGAVPVVAELMELKANCRYSENAEDNDFDITIMTDVSRFESTAAIDTDEQQFTDVTASDQYKVRNLFSIYPEAGFYGSFFKATLQKKIPHDGNFKFYGTEFVAVPVNIDPEFLSAMGTITNAWES